MIPGRPLWSEFVIPPSPLWPGGTLHADVAIVGAGFTGLSSAYHVLKRRPGARVVVLEAESLGAGGSGRTTGMLGPGVGQSLLALVRRHGPARAAALYRATLRAVQDVDALVAREGIDCELEMSGQLHIARTPAERARLAVESTFLRQWNLPGQPLDDAALDRALRLPARPPAPGPAALRLPVAGMLHPTKLLAALAARVRAGGGTIYERARVTAIDRRRSERIAIAGGGEVCAGEVIVATGAYTPALGMLRGRILPLQLQVVATDPLDGPALDALGWKGREAVIEVRRAFSYFRLTRDERILFGGGVPRYRWGGATDDDGRAPAALDGVAAALRSMLGTHIPLRVAAGWTGVVDYVADALPAVQHVRGCPWLVHAVGWCGHGLALSIAAGAWVTHVLCEGAAPDDLPWHRERPPLVPSEPLRWLGVRASVAAMTLGDRWC